MKDESNIRRGGAADVIANVGTVIVALCLLVVTAGFVKDHFLSSSPKPGSADDPDTAPTSAVANWAALANGGAVVGNSDAKVRVVVFSDYQCPFCAVTDSGLAALLGARAGRVAVIYRNYPQPAIHPFAVQAALAAECAKAQGRFAEFHRALFANQQLLGIRQWDQFAEAAGVPSHGNFSRCLRERRGQPTIDADVAAGHDLHIRGTPAIIVDGRLLAPGSSVHRIGLAIDSALANSGSR